MNLICIESTITGKRKIINNYVLVYVVSFYKRISVHFLLTGKRLCRILPKYLLAWNCMQKSVNLVQISGKENGPPTVSTHE